MRPVEAYNTWTDICTNPMPRMGKNVRIHPTVQIFNPEMIEIGDNVRIDAFSILSGGIGLKIGSHIHIACGSYIYAGGGVELEDFTQFAPRLLIMSTCDDFTGESLVGPCLPDKYKPFLQKEKVIIKRHTLTGAGVTIMPGVTVHDGVSIGAHSLVMRDCKPWLIYAGIPARPIRPRSRKMEEYEKEFLKEWTSKADS